MHLPFLCLGLSVLMLDSDSGISHPVEKQRKGPRRAKKTEDHISAWEPEGSCRDREVRGSHQSDNAVRRPAQGKLNQVVSALACVGSGLVWGHSLCSTMRASSDKVSGDGLGLARGPECMALRVAVWAIGELFVSFRWGQQWSFFRQTLCDIVGFDDISLILYCR